MSSDGPFRLVVVDLFCGAGGFSTGMVGAIVDHFREEIATETGLDPDTLTQWDAPVQDWLGENVALIAVNHWDLAVETYRENHPWATVYNAKVQAMHPPDAVTIESDGESVTLRVDVLIAGPSCIPWSKAKGGMAEDDQKRMGPRHVAWWLELLRPEAFLLENVEGFLRWGPLYWDEDAGEYKMEKDGSLFKDWVETLTNLGYTVDWGKFVAADYGDPQSRKRLFVMGRLNYEPQWPAPTHSQTGCDETKPYRTAAELIDWEDPGESMWTKSRPLVQNTNARIAKGIRRFGHDALEPFAAVIEDLTKDDVRAMQQDTVPVTDAAAAAEERDEPFLVEGPVLLDADAEMATDGGDGDERELTTLCVPQVMGQHGGAIPRPVDEPVPTVTAQGGCIHYIDPEAFVLPRKGRQRGNGSNPARSIDDPLHTVTAKNHDGRKFEACLIPLYNERPDQDPRTRDVDRPLMTVPASKGPAGISRPFLVKYYNKGPLADVDDPMPTVPASETLALCIPEYYPWGLDVRYRMLSPRECARAQGFPDHYAFAAETVEHQRELIGNAVPVNMARELCRTLLEPTTAPTLNYYGETPQPASAGGDDD